MGKKGGFGQERASFDPKLSCEMEYLSFFSKASLCFSTPTNATLKTDKQNNTNDNEKAGMPWPLEEHQRLCCRDEEQRLLDEGSSSSVVSQRQQQHFGLVLHLRLLLLFFFLFFRRKPRRAASAPAPALPRLRKGPRGLFLPRGQRGR